MAFQNATLPITEARDFAGISAELPASEISHFNELVSAGRIIAILAWADRMTSKHAHFRPISDNIDFLCKTLNMRALRELAERLRGS
jgi:hypothetical protein